MEGERDEGRRERGWRDEASFTAGGGYMFAVYWMNKKIQRG